MIANVLPAQFMMAQPTAPLAPLTDNERALLRQLGEQCQQVLAEHGLGRVMMDGGVMPPRFESLSISDDSRVATIKLDVSPASLPGKGAVDKAASRPLLNDLSGRTGFPWAAVNHVGVTYTVWLAQQQHRPMPQTVDLDSTLRPGDQSFPIALGVDQTGAHRWMSLFDTVHILVGGESRSGKSTWAHAMLSSLLPFYSPDELNLALLDAKGVEFLMWRDLPHLIAPIADEPAQADTLLASLAAEMDRRKTLFEQMMARDLNSYNRVARAFNQPTLPLLLVVMDELTDFIVQRPDIAGSISRSLTRLASKGAAFGIFLVVLTQNPKAKIIDTLIKGNMSTRIAFRVAAPEHSKTILGSNINGRGAHQLPRQHRGRMMARLDGDLTEMQGYYVSDEMIRTLMASIADKGWVRAPRLKLIDPQAFANEAAAVGRGMSDAADFLGETEDFEPTRALTLTETEWQVLRVAVNELDSELAVGRLYELVREQGISKGAISRLIAMLSDNGWIEEPATSNSPRRCTMALVEAVAVHFADTDK